MSDTPEVRHRFKAQVTAHASLVPVDVPRLRDVLKRRPVGSLVDLEISWESHKTSEQLGYLFGVAYKTLLWEFRYIRDADGNAMFRTTEDVHEFMKGLLFFRFIEMPDGQVEKQAKSLKGASMEETSQYIDSLIEHCWHRWEFVIPAPQKRSQE